jgi:peptide/nickel transport system permease protein
MFVMGTIITLTMLVLAIGAPWIAPRDPLRTNTLNRLAPPSGEHWMGTDNHGRDLFSRVVYGARVSMAVGVGVVVFTTLVGGGLGLVAGFYRRVSGPIMRVMDALLSFPAVLLAIAILAALGPMLATVVVALTITYAPHTARVARAAALGLKELDYVSAARSLGCSDVRIIVRHIVPNLLSPVMVQATFILALAILAEAGLSFVGAGTQPPTPSWGNILADGRQFMYQAWWMTVFPGSFIALVVLGVNLLGDGIRDVLDPHMKGIQMT